MLEFTVLGSGSSGNCAIVRSGSVTLLLDAGLSARQIQRRLDVVGVDSESLSGILITHEHGDHTRGIDVFCRKREGRLPVFCTAMTREVIRESIRADVDWRLFESGCAFSIEHLTVQSFPVAHDAVDPLGFLIRDEASSVMGVVSDVGHVTNLVRAHLRESDALFIEANYDEVLLQNDTKRPWPTKQRISSRHGHLSNEQAAELATDVATDRLTQIVLGHLSKDCNHPELARDHVAKKLHEHGFRGVEVCCASQDEPTEWFRVGVPVATAPAEESAIAEARERGVEQGSLL